MNVESVDLVSAFLGAMDVGDASDDCSSIYVYQALFQNLHT
jgi:hypothetical protein